MRIGEKLSKFLYSAGGAVVFVFSAIIAAWLFYLSSCVTAIMAYADEHVFFIKDVGPGMVIGILILLFLFSLVYSKHKKFWNNETKVLSLLKAVSIVLTILFVLLGFVIVKTTHLAPIYDQFWVFSAAKAFLSGDYQAWQTGKYMDMFPFQNGMVLLMMPFACLGDDGFFVFQYLNVFVLIFINVGVAWIAREYFGRKWGYATYIGVTLTLQMWGQITYVYGFLLQIAFGIWGIYHLIRYDKEHKVRNAVMGVIFLALCPAFKYNGVLFVITASLMMFVRFLRCREGRLRYLIIIATLVFCTVGSLCGIRLYFNRVAGGSPESGIVMTGYAAVGISESSIAPGWFNDINTSVYEEYAGDAARIEERYKEIINERLTVFKTDPLYCLRFYARKNASMWAEPAMQCFTNTSIRNVYGTLSYTWKDILYNGGIINTALYIILDIGQSCLYFGLILKLFWIFRKRKIRESLAEADLLVLFIGGFIYHFIFEAQCYYVLPYFLAMVPYAIKGYGETISEIATVGVKKSKGIRFTLAVMILGFVIYLIPSKLLDNTMRLGTATGDYLWYLQNELDWKDPEYGKEK